MTSKQVNLEGLGIRETETGEFEKTPINPSLKAEDLIKAGVKIGKDTVAIIKNAEQRTFEDGEKIMVSMSIEALEKSKDGENRSLGLNSTNTLTMLNAYGQDLESWTNKMINVKVEETLYKGKKVACIRLYKYD
jgi:hypothetical protein